MTAHPRSATPPGGAATRRTTSVGRAVRLGAAVTASALGGAFALAAPLSASAAEPPVSFAEGRFLSGTLLGMDLSRVLALDSAQARNDGSQPTQTSKDPLDAKVLEDAVVLDPPQPPQFEIGEVVQIGPVAQYAEAHSDGTSFGASGAVADDGAIGIGADRRTPPADATLDLEALLGSEFASTLTDLKLELHALAASARGEGNVATGDYSIAGAHLVFSSPALADLTPKVDAALHEVDDSLAQLVGRDGALVGDVNGLLVGIDPVLNLLGGTGEVSATIDTGALRSSVLALLKKEYGNGAVSLDLETGDVRVDLAELLGGDLGRLDPGTELLTDSIVNGILHGITSTVSSIGDQVVDAVEAELRDANVSIRADLFANVAQSPIVQEVCRLVDRVVTTPVLGEVSLLERLEALANGLVGDLTDRLLDDVGDFVFDDDGAVKQIVGFVDRTVQETVCGSTATAVAPLTTSVVLELDATIAQLLSGVATGATADVDVLGIPVNLDLGLLLDDLGDSLLDGLFDADGAVAGLEEALESTLVSPATEALLGTGEGTVGEALRDVLSITVNVKETGSPATLGPAAEGSLFTQTAVRVSVLGSSLATLDLASATVGPGITSVADCTDPDGCVGGGGPGTVPTGGGSAGALAYTGVGIATLVAAILALLAAGLYLVREGYRRNHQVASTVE